MEKPRLQFGLATLFGTTAAVGAVLALMFHMPIVPATLILLTLVFICSSLVCTGFAYAKQSFRAFCIGAAVPLSVMLIFVARHTYAYTSPFVISVLPVNSIVDEIHIPGTPYFFGTGLLSAMALGYICLAFRWCVVRREQPLG